MGSVLVTATDIEAMVMAGMIAVDDGMTRLEDRGLIVRGNEVIVKANSPDDRRYLLQRGFPIVLPRPKEMKRILKSLCPRASMRVIRGLVTLLKRIDELCPIETAAPPLN